MCVFGVQVIGRIFYVVDRTWNNRITASDLRRSNFLQVHVLVCSACDECVDMYMYIIHAG